MLCLVGVPPTVNCSDECDVGSENRANEKRMIYEEIVRCISLPVALCLLPLNAIYHKYHSRSLCMFRYGQ